MPSVSWESTLTDNVNLAPSDQRTSDWINQLTPSIRFNETGAHTKLSGSLSLPVLLYARTTQNNYVAPEANVTGTLEAIEKFLFIDASVNVSQQYLTPFGARPNNLANATQNRYTTQTYSISPYVKGNAADGVDYELRQKETLSNANGVSVGTNTNRSYTSDITGHIQHEARPGGWLVEYARSDIRFPGQDVQSNETTELERFSALYRADSTLQLRASAGYEDNRFFFTRDNGVIYGAGVEWHPTDRTSLSAFGEHRFFGVSYHVSFDHHTPLTVWSIKASRDTTSYPQQLADLPAGANVSGLLDSLLGSRVQDPAQRQVLVDQFIRDRGLPLLLSSPLALFSQQITLVESETATFGILGARNTILFTAYRARSQPIEGSDVGALTPLLAQLTNNTQVGTNVAWTHQLAPSLTLGANADWSRTIANLSGGGVTRLFRISTNVSRTLTALTSVYVGARYQDSHSDVDASYREVAVLVGLTHTFH